MWVGRYTEVKPIVCVALETRLGFAPVLISGMFVPTSVKPFPVSVGVGKL